VVVAYLKWPFSVGLVLSQFPAFGRFAEFGDLKNSNQI